MGLGVEVLELRFEVSGLAFSSEVLLQEHKKLVHTNPQVQGKSENFSLFRLDHAQNLKSYIELLGAMLIEPTCKARQQSFFPNVHLRVQRQRLAISI